MIQGNASKRPINDEEPKPEVASSEVPPPLPMDGKALEIWQLMTPMLAKIGLLTVCDLKALARYCDIFVRWQVARDFLDAHGETYQVEEMVRVYDKENKTWDTVLEKGAWTNYPQVKNFMAYSKELGRLEGELGLTPASRSRIRIEIFKGTSQQDAMTEYLASNQRKPLAG